jgi:hypothetical protein
LVNAISVSNVPGYKRVNDSIDRALAPPPAWAAIREWIRLRMKSRRAASKCDADSQTVTRNGGSPVCQKFVCFVLVIEIDGAVVKSAPPLDILIAGAVGSTQSHPWKRMRLRGSLSCPTIVLIEMGGRHNKMLVFSLETGHVRATLAGYFHALYSEFATKRIPSCRVVVTAGTETTGRRFYCVELDTPYYHGGGGGLILFSI